LVILLRISTRDLTNVTYTVWTESFIKEAMCVCKFQEGFKHSIRI